MYYRPFTPYYYGYYRYNNYIPFRQCYGYYCSPYNNFIDSNYSNVNQQIYNQGIMEDIIQQSIISGASETEEPYTITADEITGIDNIIPIILPEPKAWHHK